jgi:hypothetical protein
LNFEIVFPKVKSFSFTAPTKEDIVHSQRQQQESCNIASVFLLQVGGWLCSLFLSVIIHHIQYYNTIKEAIHHHAIDSRASQGSIEGGARAGGECHL